MVNIDFGKNESRLVHLTLIDAYGKIVWFYNDMTNNIFIPVSRYAAGVYFLQVKTNQGTYLRKVIIE